MLLQTHDALETYVYVVTLCGVALAGWTAFLQSQKARLEEKMSDLKVESHDVWEKQWQRIDELRDNAAKFITRDQHEETIKDIYDAIKEAIRPVADNIDRLSDKLDRMIEGRTK